MAHERAGVDVDGGHGFSRVDYQITARLERHLAVQRLLNFVLYAIQVKNRPLAGVMLKAVGDFRHKFSHKLGGLLESFSRVDANFFDLGTDQVTQGAQRQAQVFIDDARCSRRFNLQTDLVPQAAQVANVHQDLIRPGAFSGRTQNKTSGFLDAFLRHAITDHLLEALTFGFVFDLQRNADMSGARHVHQVARRNRQLRGQACAF